MKIAYVLNGNAYDKNSWSGTHYYVRESLERLGHEVYVINAPAFRHTPRHYLHKILNLFHKGHFDTRRTMDASRQWAEHIYRNLQPGTDCVLSLTTLAIAALDNLTIPVYLYIDGVFQQIRTLHRWNLSDHAIKEADRVELAALNRAEKIILAAEHTRHAVTELYGIPAEKTVTIPFGANIDTRPTSRQIEDMIAARCADTTMRLLFIGVDWRIKGGDIVLEVGKRLHDRGIPMRIDFVGIDNIPVPLPEYAYSHGFLNKNDAKQHSLQIQLMQQAHFLCVPTHADAYGLVFCEANAHALPGLALNTGGPTTIIAEGVNGHLFDVGCNPADIADTVESYYRQKEHYAALCRTSRRRFEQTLNWKVASERLTRIMSSANNRL